MRGIWDYKNYTILKFRHLHPRLEEINEKLDETLEHLSKESVSEEELSVRRKLFQSAQHLRFQIS